MAVYFDPWESYPMLALERLVAVGEMMREERDGAAELHNVAAGDSPWSLGCRIYSRTISRIARETLQWPWLRVLPESHALRFTFAIGAMPIKFYKGEPDDVPSRSLRQSFAELRQLRMAFLENRNIAEKCLRIAVEADSSGKTTAVTLVEVDQEGFPTRMFEIPLDSQNIIVMRPKPIDLAPPELKIIEVDKRDATREGSDGKSADMGGSEV